MIRSQNLNFQYGTNIALKPNQICIEERKVFPLAATLLDITDLNAIAREVANRRGLIFSRDGTNS